MSVCRLCNRDHAADLVAAEVAWDTFFSALTDPEQEVVLWSHAVRALLDDDDYRSAQSYAESELCAWRLLGDRWRPTAFVELGPGGLKKTGK
jgi:hypothetical protein